jgi:hypothetical protein
MAALVARDRPADFLLDGSQGALDATHRSRPYTCRVGATLRGDRCNGKAPCGAAVYRDVAV